MQLPSIRQLSLRPMNPALAPMEVADPYNVSLPSLSQSGMGYRIIDLMGKSDGAQRKLPIPRVAVHDLLNGTSGFSSNSSSAAGSLSGGDLSDRM